MKKIAIVILHFVNKKQTINCLESVKQLEVKGLRLKTIVVDNSEKEHLDDLKDKFNDFVFLKTDGNLGYAAGNNLGIKAALKENVDFVFIVNNDTILDKKILVELVKASSLDEKIGILGPKIYFAPGYEFHKERYQAKDQGRIIWYVGGLIDWQNIVASHRGVDEVDYGQYDTPGETDFVSGCAMFVKKEVFEKIGLFDKRFFLYWEDVDFCQKAKKVGFGVTYIPQAKLWHANAGSSEVGGDLHDYYMTRNRLLFGMKYASFKTRLALIKESFKILRQGRPWQRIGVKDFYLRKFGQGSL